MTESTEHPAEPTGEQSATPPAEQPAAPPTEQPPPPAYGTAPPPAYGTAPPPAYGTAPPPAYGQPTPPAYGQPQGYPPPGAYPPGMPGAPVMISPADERTWATAAHWSALAAWFIGLPFLGPLVVLLVQGNKSPWVRRHAVESLNFQISLMIYAIVSAVLILVIIGFFLLIAVGIFGLVMTIIGAMRTNNGEDYRYPLCIRMIS